MDRQRMLVLFGVAWLSAAALSWFFYTKAVAPHEEKRTLVVVAARDMPMGAKLQKGDLRNAGLAGKDIPKGAVFQARDAIDRVLLYPVSANEPVLLPKLSAVNSAEGVSSTIEPGYRAMSVQITDVSGVAGLVQPNSHVDVLFTRPGTMAEAITSIILQNVKVLSTGRITQVGQPVDAKAPKMPVVTLVLTPADAQKLELAKNQGKISLALRNPQDNVPGNATGPVTTEILDPMVSARLARARRGRTTSIMKANLDDPDVWQRLTGEVKAVDKAKLEEEARRRREKDADKPRVVVDVYRGDKHVQEMFR
jgi:pilus assembly protein CpaB